MEKELDKINHLSSLGISVDKAVTNCWQYLKKKVDKILENSLTNEISN